MKTYTAASSVSFAFLFLLPAIARAETVIAESMDWVVATSDRILVGKVAKVDTVKDQDNRECQAVTVAISKTLKGPTTEGETFLLRPYIDHVYAEQWREEGIPIAFCLIKNDGKRISIPADQFAWTLRDAGNGPDAVLLGKSKNYWTGCIPVLTRDFEVLTEPAAILNFIEQTVKEAAKGNPSHYHIVEAPGDTAVYKKLWSGSAVELIVPVDEKLEVLGQAWCKSASPLEREEGAAILRHFKNKKNIAVLESLLQDPSTAEETRSRSVPGERYFQLVYRKKIYYVRQAAFDALREFGVNADRPVLEELLEGRDEPDPDRWNGRE